jgi:anti-sigma B factor antagonist
MVESEYKKSWENAPSGMGSGGRNDRLHTTPFNFSGASCRPDLRVRTVGALTVVDLVNAEEIFDEETVQELSERILRLVEEEHVRLLLNLSSVRYASSSMIALLAWLCRRLDMAGGVLRLCGLDPVLFDMLRLCRLDRFVEVYTSEATALRSMQSSEE